MSDRPFSNKIQIKRDMNGFMLPAGMTNKATANLQHAVNAFGHLIEHDSTINMEEFSKKIKENYSNDKTDELAHQLIRMDSLTFVVFDGDHRNSEKVEWSYNVIGADTDDAEQLIDLIADNEIKKSKYQDNKIRRMSVFVKSGGEIKSGVFSNEKPENKKTVKPS